MGVGGSSDNADLQELHDAWRSKLALRGEAEASALAEAEASALAERARKLDLRKKARRAKLDPRKKAQAKSSRGAEISTTLEPKEPWSRDSPLPSVVKEVEVCPGLEPPVVKEEDEDGEECPGLEPFFFDEAAAVAEHEVRTRREQEEERRLQRRLQMEQDALRKIRQYDPKKGRICYTRFSYVDLGTFDLDEESPLGPMRNTDNTAITMVTDVIFKERKDQFLSGGDDAPSAHVKTGLWYLDELLKPAKLITYKFDPSSQSYKASEVEQLFFPCDSINVLSVKIVSSDVGFPINVYGTVIARDCVDEYKCVYLFRCNRDQSHLILNKEEQLILTGPKRGLALEDTMYIEIDLKIKGDGKQKTDKQLSKGFFGLKEVSDRSKEEMLVESSVDSMLSKVVVKCAVEKHAVEATIAIEVVQGNFCGEITACTTNVRGSLVLYDSKLVSPEMTGKGVIPLLRPIVAVGLNEKLMVTIARAGVCKVDRGCTIKFTPSLYGRDKAEVTCGSIKMLVKVAWSIISRHRVWRPYSILHRLDRPSDVV